MNRTSFLDCKHKNMRKNEAPPDKFGVLHRLLYVEFHGFTSRVNFRGLSLVGFFRESIGPFNILPFVIHAMDPVCSGMIVWLVVSEQ